MYGLNTPVEASEECPGIVERMNSHAPVTCIWKVGFRVQGSGFRVQGSGFRVQGSGFRVQGSVFRETLGRSLAGSSSPSVDGSLAMPLRYSAYCTTCFGRQGF